MRVICFGDSNTYGFDPRSYLGERYSPDSRWVDILAKRTGWEIINAGENGREIPWREHELKQDYQMCSGLPADLLIIMLGTNDLLQGTDVETVAVRMKTFLDQLPIDKDKILLVAPPPMQPGEWVTEKRLVTASLRLADAYLRLAQRSGVRFADAAMWNVALTFDGVHFTEAGHRSFAAGILKEII